MDIFYTKRVLYESQVGQVLTSMIVYWHVCVHACERTCVQTPMSVCLSVCLSVWPCVCPFDRMSD